MTTMKNILCILVVLCSFSIFAGNAAAQTADASVSGKVYAPRPSYSSARLGLQGRLDALNMIAEGETALAGPSQFAGFLFVPIVTPGFRFLDERLYLGLGFGFGGYDDENGAAADSSRSAFSLSPLAMYDVLTDRYAALALGGWLNVLVLGEEENQDDDGFGIGLNIAAGIRGKISPGLAIGSEFGWGFINISRDNDDDRFFHGLFGTILFEASVGI
jgi:hypothetical protein